MSTGVICDGHNEDDLLEFSNFMGKSETYTNKEMYAFISPDNDELPYTYDTFEFSFCDALGYDFLESTDSAKKGTKSSVAATKTGSRPKMTVDPGPGGMGRK